jgi:hypothetical protein
MNYQWDKGLFSNTYEIKDDQHNIVGELSGMGLTTDKMGSLYNQKAFFESEGLFKNATVIRDPETLQQIGYIKFNSWKTQATIYLNGKEYLWKYDNWKQTSWKIIGPDTELRFKSPFSDGNMLVPADHHILALAGLYIRNHYMQAMFVVLFAVIFPILFT